MLVFAAGSPAPLLAAAPDDPIRTEARALAYAGVEAYAASDFVTAHQRLERAYELLPVPSLGLWSARALVKVGQLIHAELRYLAVSRMLVAPTDPPVQRSAQLDAARELLQLSPRIPTLSFRLDGATADQVSVEVDGVLTAAVEGARPLRLDPGRHEVVGTRGAEKTMVILELAEGQREELWLRFARPKAVATPLARAEADSAPRPRASASHPLRTAGWLTLAAGGTCLATGMVGYLVGRGEHGELERLAECSSAACAARAPEAYSSYGMWRSLQVVGLLSGGLLGAAGVTLLVAGGEASGASSESPQLGLRLEPLSATVFGNF
jgi:hypothetical protein